VYLAGAWLFLEALGFVADNFGWPTYITRSAIVLAAVGFFAALVLAWYHGEKGRQRASGVELLILAGILVIAGAAVALLGRGKDGGREPTAEQAGAASGVIDPRSVAVLPFANLSADPENEYFSDGITSDIIIRLGKVADLPVIARTSVMQYKNTEKPIRQIGQELRVAAIVEGEVQRMSDRVRINAQLIDADTELHLWADTYDRELTAENIFEIQSEIAQQIAVALSVTLTAAELASIERAPSENLEAYDSYLIGQQYLNQRTREGFEQAIAYFERAIEQDSAFALAYSGLADALTTAASWGFGLPRDVYPRAKALALKALEIDNTLGEAYVSLAGIEEVTEWNWPAAEALYRRGLELSPQYAVGHYWHGYLLATLGRFEQATEEIARAHALDPMSPRIYFALGQPLYYGGELEQALEYCRAAQAMYPDFKPGGCTGGYLAVGRYEEAIAEAESGRGQHGTMLAPGTEPEAYLAMAYALAGKKDEARRVLHELQTRSRADYVSPSALAYIYVGLGEPDSAMYWFERAYEARVYDIVWIRNDPLMETLRSDPRFQDLVRRLNFPD